MYAEAWSQDLWQKYEDLAEDLNLEMTLKARPVFQGEHTPQPTLKDSSQLWTSWASTRRLRSVKQEPQWPWSLLPRK